MGCETKLGKSLEEKHDVPNLEETPKTETQNEDCVEDKCDVVIVEVKTETAVVNPREEPKIDMETDNKDFETKTEKSTEDVVDTEQEMEKETESKDCETKLEECVEDKHDVLKVELNMDTESKNEDNQSYGQESSSDEEATDISQVCHFCEKCHNIDCSTCSTCGSDPVTGALMVLTQVT